MLCHMTEENSVTLEDLTARLDKQAEAILRLRRDRDDIRDRVAALEAGAGATPSTEPRAGETGTYVPKRTCVLCGADKQGRKTLTCATCGSARNQALKAGQAPALVPACLNCGKTKRTSTLLCTPCSASFKVWSK